VVEVVVADGGSRDGSVERARGLGVRVLECPRGRGTQLARAAGSARGRWLWTVHADALPAPGTLARVLAFARRGSHPWGFLRTRVEGGGAPYRVLEALTEMRARSLCLPYGDQGVVVKRSLFEAVGGYEEVPLMEDVLLARRLARRAAPALVGGTLVVDGRRWRRHGLLGATARNLATLFRFSVLGRDPARLAATYDHRILSP
jgi:glycosyltransferase involved in cell wall biosynthesis